MSETRGDCRGGFLIREELHHVAGFNRRDERLYAENADNICEEPARVARTVSKDNDVFHELLPPSFSNLIIPQLFLCVNAFTAKSYVKFSCAKIVRPIFPYINLTEGSSPSVC